MPKYFNKTPNEVLDYTFDWSAYLDEGEAIASQSVSVETGLTKDSVSASGSAVTVWVSGGSIGETYKITCIITTDSSPARTAERIFFININ